jgi:hypothetical protein
MKLSAACLLSLSFLVPCAWVGDEPEPRAEESALFTFVAHDDLQSSLDLRQGRAGGRVEDGEIELEGAQLAFEVFAPDRLSFGFVREESVDVLDLGPVSVSPQPRARDGAEKFALGLFHTLFFDGARFWYTGPGGAEHPCERADRILGPLPPRGVRHLEPRAGHTYLVRLQREGLGSVEEFFKFQVVALLPGHSLTIRWAPVPSR